MDSNQKKNIDPLYQLFEHFLVTRSYDDSNEFTKQLAEHYMAYLDSTPAHVPFHTRTHVVEDLTHEAHEMLVKKMYGCSQATDYQNCGTVMQIKKGEELHPSVFIAPFSHLIDSKG